jgi:hypothetical protein
MSSAAPDLEAGEFSCPSHRILTIICDTGAGGRSEGSTSPPTRGGRDMAESARMVSVEPQRRVTLPEVAWESVSDPGAYVEVGTGDLYRIPKEALIPGSSPVIRKESAGASRLVQLSPNPFITTLQARMLACEHNIEPNF